MSMNQPNESLGNVQSTEQSSNELKVSPIDNSKRVMYNSKILLSKHDEIELVAGTGGSPVAVRAAESLVRLGYVTYESIKTDTILSSTGRRRTKLSIKLKKTEDYLKLFEENEEIRRKTQEIESK
mmetsp:Transcript_21004/g.21794  ORF Transcript_21004/g.21794 Transcript_21004/m.21794 type:complete len:125 (-) Transcript_21004:146-520(-)